MRRFRTDFTPCQLEFFEPFDGGYGGSSPAGGGLDAVRTLPQSGRLDGGEQPQGLPG
jgi:hypothetical protein